MKRDDLPKILYQKINIVEPYPEKVKPVDKMMDITAFFPGGKGLWSETQSDVFPNILILGQDFSTVDDYRKMLRNESTDLECPTWRYLIKLLNEAEIELTDCFYSNVFMGLRETASMVGKFPGFKDKSFVKRNVEFLSYQIETIRPKVIITLGKFAAELLTKLSDTDLKIWKNYNALRVANIGLITNVHFNNHVCTCVALEHTSMRNSNVKRREYSNVNGQHQGNAAEVEMLKDAVHKKAEGNCNG